MTQPGLVWPRALGPNTRENRARVIARAAWQALNTLGPPGVELAAQILATARLFGDDQWLDPPTLDVAPGERLTTEHVATLAGVTPATVQSWATRGLIRGTTRARRHLVPDRDGTYDPDTVTAWLRWRDDTATDPNPHTRTQTARATEAKDAP